MAYEADRKVVLSHQALVERIRLRVTSFAASQYEGLGSWRDDDIDRFIARVVPVVESGQVRVAQLTDSYLDSLARIAGAEVADSIAASEMVGLRGVDATDVYRRPAVVTYTALSEGKPLDEAVRLGAIRASSLASTDLQMAHTRAAYAKFGDSNIVGYRRVLAPGENCALCAVASTQRYHKRDLMPIHASCRCSVMPIYGSHDPGQVINGPRLQAINEEMAARGVSYAALKSDRSIRIDDHGEHGPVLTWSDQGFTGAADIPRKKGLQSRDPNTWTSSSGRVYELLPSDPAYVPQGDF